MNIKDRLLLALVPPFAAVLIRIIGVLTKVEFLGKERAQAFWGNRQYVIFALWHDQLLLMANYYEGPGTKVLISPSKDGELVARALRRFGHQAVRGSSSRGGREALRKLVAMKEEAYDFAITPDGPKGPRHQVKPGVIQLARLTGRPILPVAFACSRGYRFNSWDRFLLPLPFGKGVFSIGEPLFYNRAEPFEEFQQRLQEAMSMNQNKAIRTLEEKGVSAV